MNPPVKILLYALGGGLGHLTRGMSLAQILGRYFSVRISLLTNSSLAAAARSEAKRYPFLELSEISPKATAEEVGALVRNLLTNDRPELWIVDTFPRGLGGELVDCFAACPNLPKVLIGRTLPEEYLLGFELSKFVEEHYDLILRVEQSAPWRDSKCAYDIEPPGIRQREEIFTKQRADQLLSLSPDQKCILIVGSGKESEIDELVTLFPAWQRTWPTDFPPLRLALPPGWDRPTQSIPPEAIVKHYPLCELFSAVRIVVGGIGFNLVQETARAGVPMLGMIRARLYDNQAQRAQQFDHVRVISPGDCLVEVVRQELALPLPAKAVVKQKGGDERFAELLRPLLAKAASGSESKFTYEN